MYIERIIDCLEKINDEQKFSLQTHVTISKLVKDYRKSKDENQLDEECIIPVSKFNNMVKLTVDNYKGYYDQRDLSFHGFIGIVCKSSGQGSFCGKGQIFWNSFKTHTEDTYRHQAIYFHKNSVFYNSTSYLCHKDMIDACVKNPDIDVYWFKDYQSFGRWLAGGTEEDINEDWGYWS